MRLSGISILALVITTAAHAQESRSLSLGVHAGAAFTTASLNGHVSKLGPLLSATAEWTLTPRIAFAAEVMATRFAEHHDHDHGLCPDPNPQQPTPCHEPTGPISMGGMMTTVRVRDASIATVGKGSYVVVGGGVYRALSHPSASGATRLGWTAGFGFLLRPRTPAVSLDVRYHQIPRWPGDRVSVIPITLGLSR